MIKDKHKGIFAAISANVIFGLNIPVTQSLIAHWMTPMGYTISISFLYALHLSPFFKYPTPAILIPKRLCSSVREIPNSRNANNKIGSWA